MDGVDGVGPTAHKRGKFVSILKMYSCYLKNITKFKEIEFY